MSTLSIPAFVAKWAGSARTERSASQEHFIDLCRLVGHPTPAEVDPKGEFFTFEKGAEKTTGGQGFADAWKKGHFAWEYKGPRANLDAAYQQVLKYREDLENPPLLVVCDLNRFEVHTNFTGTVKQRYVFDLSDLQENTTTETCPIPPLDVLRGVFIAPERLKPARTAAQVTEEAAREFAKLSRSLAERGHDPEQAAHFLMRLLFCLFSEDIGLLPDRLFTRLVDNTRFDPPAFHAQVGALFRVMATGGWFGPEHIEEFDGGLFADDMAVALTSADIEVLHAAGRLDWSSVEPAIFGTLFERSLDPAKRAQLGAHYTSRDDILLIVEPVLMEPLRRRWADLQDQARGLVMRRDTAATPGQRRARQADLEKLLTGFQAELAGIRVLDPACGSGNFLYVALRRLLDLEKEVITFAATSGMTMPVPQVGPEQLYGIEINPYAHELAQVVAWIGYIQWLRDNGFGVPSSPILKPLDNIRHMDAILAVDEDGTVGEPLWPKADVVIGNPPFLGDKRMRTELGHDYVETLRRLYAGRVPGGADLVTYWFDAPERCSRPARRSGPDYSLPTRSGVVRIDVSSNGSRRQAPSSWPGVTAPGYSTGLPSGFRSSDSTEDTTRSRMLDGQLVSGITANLTSAIDVTAAPPLLENRGIASIGDQKTGPFDIRPEVAARLLSAPLNPNGRPNSDVVRPWVNGSDIVRRPRGMWLIDFGHAMTEDEAALYEAPFEYVRRHVKPLRDQSATPALRQRWWLHERPRPEMRDWIAPLTRFVATPTLSRHRVFVWLYPPTLPDKQLVVFARDDDYFFGVLHSHPHELWTLRRCTWMGVGDDPRYIPSSTFETFPFPWQSGQEPVGDPRVVAIAGAARELHERRDAWLNPPGASAVDLAKRTLTNLYNERPAWLQMAHAKLDAAVLAAYGWPDSLTDDELLERLLALNLSRPPA